MKKISTGTVKAFVKERTNEGVITQEFPVGDSIFTVQIRTRLTIDEKTVFVSRVATNCFDVADNYHPELFMPMFHATVLQMCTNIPVMTMKGASEHMDLDAMDAVYEAMDLDGLDVPAFQKMTQEMETLCRQRVDLRMRNGVVVNALADAAASIRDLAENLSRKVENVDTDELTQYAAKLSNAVDDLDEGGILNGILELRER